MTKDEILALLTPPRVDDVADRWGARGRDVRFLRALENFVYEFESSGRPLILRLTHSSHRTPGEIAAELEFVEYLARHGAAVARPVRSRAGRLIESLPVPGSYFNAAVFERAPGAKPNFDRPQPALDRLYRDWGAMLGSVHRLVPGYRDGGGDTRRHMGIEDDIIRHAATYLPPEARHVVPLLTEIIAEIRELPRTPQDYGLLHTDCHHGNFHAAGSQLTLFDFDDCCHHWFAYDLAVPVWHFPLVDRGQDPARDRAVLTRFLQEFIRGYQQTHVFQRHWLRQLPLFFRLRDLQLFIFSWKMGDPARPDPWQLKFRRERLALIESGRPSVEVEGDALSV